MIIIKNDFNLFCFAIKIFKMKEKEKEMRRQVKKARIKLQ